MQISVELLDEVDRQLLGTSTTTDQLTSKIDVEQRRELLPPVHVPLEYTTLRVSPWIREFNYGEIRQFEAFNVLRT